MFYLAININRETLKRIYSLFLILGLAVIITILGFWLGRVTSKPTSETFISNTSFVKQIAELSTLEVHGNASLKRSNLQNDGSFSDAMRKMFMENSMNLSIPYIAKYGVSIDSQEIKVNQKDSIVTVILPNPKLLSFELNLSNADINTQKGWLQYRSDQDYITAEKKLYAQSKEQLAQNMAYIQQTKQKIEKIINDYYAPMNYKAVVLFGNEKAATKLVPSNTNN